MRILLSGFLVLSAWSAFATYIYVCKIRELCDAPMSEQTVALSHPDAIVADTTHKQVIQEQAIVSKKLVIYFEFDKSEFNASTEASKYFDESNSYLVQNPNVKLEIIGHTDAIGTDNYNQALGFRRAKRMQRYFESKGILADKIIIDSKGEKQPADDNNTISGRANNRRAVITIKK